MVSVYIFCNTCIGKNESRVIFRLNFIQETYVNIKKSALNLELLVSGDINHWDILWDRNHLATHLW